MTCIKKVDDYYVLTSSTDRAGNKVSNISVAKNIEDFGNNNFKIAEPSTYKNLENYSGNTEPMPYFIENFDGQNFITINNSKTPIWAINVDEQGNIELTNSHFK